MDFPAGYGNAFVSYIALLVLCYMGQNIDSAVDFPPHNDNFQFFFFSINIVLYRRNVYIFIE